jgi:Ser/Thr protein kinase RdoA (MazF antagonist)
MCFTALVISTDTIRELLRHEWGLTDAAVSDHHGGMNSATWWVDVDGQRRFVAKSVPETATSDFLGGLNVAARLGASGIPAGAPTPTRSGATVATIEGRALALLTYVPGDELTNDDTHAVGTTLGRVHLALQDAQVSGVQPFIEIDLDQPFMGIRDWIRPAVAAALADIDLSTFTTGILHTDPAPEAFRRDPRTGMVGMIDWSVAMRGPLLYDVASAVMYAGDGLLDAYVRTGALDVEEIDAGLSMMLRFRGAVQAWYFARRTANEDLTGIDDAGGNEEGLTDARVMLER